MPISNQKNFLGWLSLVEPTNIADNQFEVLNNMSYNKDKRIQTRWWVTTFGNSIGSSPISSYFFYQNDTTGKRTALCASWTNMYEYDEATGDWNSIKSALTEYEADGTTRTRWSFAVYLNIIYMANGRDAYSSYDPATSTFTTIWLSTVWTCTFTNATNLVNLATHWLSDGASVRFTTSWTLPAELVVSRYYYVINSNTNDFQVSDTPGGTAIDFTDDGTPTTTCSTVSQPRVRYLRYMADSIYGAWEDLNPSTIYATTAGAANADTLNANFIKVWWDELGKINGMLDLGNLLLVFKDKKIYSVSWDLATSQAIDSQNGWYCHRAMKNVENAIMYYNDAGVDRLKPRSWIAWATAIASEPLSDDLRDLLNNINPIQRNNWAGFYNTAINNYYYSFDTGNDSIPDTTLVYSSLVWAWSQYNIPSSYDYGLYIDSSWEEHILSASASGWQMYEIETGFTDFWVWIETELRTKRWDFGDIGMWKTFDAVDIIWLKNEWSEITVDIIVDQVIVASSIITDDFIDITGWSITIWTVWIWLKAIGWWTSTWNDIDLFQYLIRIPMYDSWPNIQVKMSSNSNPNVWTLDQIKISREEETIDFFPTDRIW